MAAKPTLVVVSPFIDKKHGTERRVAEWTSRLTSDFDVHVYSQNVQDLDLSALTWHRIWKIPGPHLFNFLWWLAANHLCRWWHRRIRGFRQDLTFTAGTNCLDADAISIHIVFQEFERQVRPELTLTRNSITSWPTIIHRRLYYRLIISLENILYRSPKAQLILIAQKTATDLDRFYGPHEPLPVVYMGIDHSCFNPQTRLSSRATARRELNIADNQIVLVLVGNDWRKKGLTTLLAALSSIRNPNVILIVAGNDERTTYEHEAQGLGLDGRVRFMPSRPDVQFYYAAADVYVGPSLEDTFAQPPAEAMACGLPVVTTITNGTAEIMTDGVDGLILREPTNAAILGDQLRRLIEDPVLRESLGRQASKTAQNYTWDRNGKEFRRIFTEILRKKHSGVAPETEVLPSA
jgi:UDP-glucose:(heptosyl)LPS alpha-1,3-glucosyltransferase